MDSPYSPASNISQFDVFEDIAVPVDSVKSEPSEPGDEPKVKSANFKSYGDLTMASGESGATPQKRRRSAAKEILNQIESMDLLEAENDQQKNIIDELKVNNDQLMKEVVKLRHVDP